MTKTEFPLLLIASPDRAAKLARTRMALAGALATILAREAGEMIFG